MKKVGIALIVIELIIVISGIATGNPFWDFGAKEATGAYVIGKLLGYFLPMIIGIILICKANKKADRVRAEDRLDSAPLEDKKKDYKIVKWLIKIVVCVCVYFAARYGAMFMISGGNSGSHSFPSAVTNTTADVNTATNSKTGTDQNSDLYKELHDFSDVEEDAGFAAYNVEGANFKIPSQWIAGEGSGEDGICFEASFSENDSGGFNIAVEDMSEYGIRNSDRQILESLYDAVRAEMGESLENYDAQIYSSPRYDYLLGTGQYTLQYDDGGRTVEMPCDMRIYMILNDYKRYIFSFVVIGNMPDSEISTCNAVIDSVSFE